MRVARAERDRFRQMLVWSLALHILLVSAMTLAATLRPRSSSLPPPDATFMNVSLGQSGPMSGAGGGATKSPPKPTPEPPPPEEKPPSVVRPTKEVRDEVPLPDARVQKKTPEPKPDSGLRGADAASAASAQIAGGPTLSGLGLGGSGGGSPFDQDFEYAYYVQQMLARIHQRWQRTAVRGTAVAIVRFTIARDGRVLDASIETSSGVPILDRSSLRAVMLADPMPPLPNSYPRDQVGVHLRFTYTDQL
ncbi:MAG TPA: energy transducer TonB [Vicinamibacteria bacterium]|nr:energy transducer TonB [Vicinamibacteria bacterium]